MKVHIQSDGNFTIHHLTESELHTISEALVLASKTNENVMLHTRPYSPEFRKAKLGALQMLSVHEVLEEEYQNTFLQEKQTNGTTQS